MFNVHRAVFQLYSGREQVQNNIKTIYRNEERGGSTGSMIFLTTTEKVWRVWTGVTTLVFRSGCNAPALFRNLQRGF